MKRTDTECYRQALEATRAELLGCVWSGRNLAVEQTPDSMEELVFALSRDMALAMFDQRVILLGQVADALERIKTGAYGVCLECEEPISEKRLDALPWAALCLSCQETVDNRDGAEEEARVNSCRIIHG